MSLTATDTRHASLPAPLAALGGLLAAVVALAVAELSAGLLAVTSVVVAVAEGVIALAPPAVSDFAIAQLGGLNRTALITGTLVIVGVAALGIGLLARRRFGAGVVAIACLGALGVVAGVAYPEDAPLPAAVPGLSAVLAGAGALWLLVGRPDAASRRTDVATGRRAFLRAAGVLSVVAIAGVATGRWLQERAGAARERLQLGLAPADAPAPPLPEGVDFDEAGLSPFTTPNDRFYRIDTAVQVPSLRAEQWRLRVHGMVDRELELTYDDLLAREVVEADVTLTCVSNEVGGRLIGNARWRGVRVADVLREAGVQLGATQLVGRSVDGYTGGFPVAEALDGRDALLAVGMNGEPLPLVHGYPVRLVVPGLYGYVSAVKWLAELELTTFEAFDHYWVRRGWAVRAPVKTQSRIDRPRAGEDVPAGQAVIAGVAWAQHRGIDRVEVQVDEGEWQEAELAAVPSADTWRQWRLVTDLAPGPRRVRVRATDATGEVQGERRVRPVPDGAEGWHTIEVEVQA